MNTFVSIMGWICIFALVMSLLCGLIATMAWAVGKASERFEYSVREQESIRLGRQILASCHWFGESKETAKAIELLGHRLTKGYGIDEKTWREDWRQEIKIMYKTMQV